MGLRRQMLKNNSRKGVIFSYYDFQFSQGKWICFYNEELKPSDNLFFEVDDTLEKVLKKEGSDQE